MQFVLYVAVGGWNTLFGIGLFWLAVRLFGGACHYLVLAALVNVLAIFNAFLCYKLIVFRTAGHWLAECLKCYLVYGVGALCSMAILHALVKGVGWSPELSNAVASVVVVVGSFLGHKFFSFRRRV